MESDACTSAGVLGSQQSPPVETSEPSRALDTEMQGSVMMELIVDKLKLLNYERQFCHTRSPPWPRLHKFYFALPSPTNRNEQFLYFATMASWLFQQLGTPFPQPSEADDPNLTCSKIMTELIALGFAPPNWPPARLKQGYGDAVCTVLDTLCSLVLEAINYEFAPISHPNQDDPLENNDTNPNPNPNPNDNNPSELYIPDTDDPDTDDDIPRVPESQPLSIDLNPAAETAIKWKLDLERIAPQLRVTDLPDTNNWRLHLKRAKKLYNETFPRFNTGKDHLKKFEEQIKSSMEKLESHENFVNVELQGLISEFVAVKGRLLELQGEQRRKEEDVSRISGEYARLGELLEGVKQKLVEKGNEISDLSPMVKMKAAVGKMKLELREMDVEIGVLEHSLVGLQSKRAMEEGRG